MPEFINGPTNFAHLQGIINGIEKNIYLFMDVHYSIDQQTRCKSFDSIDISNYLYNIIKNVTVPTDFFMEIRSSELDIKPTNKRDIYIKEVTSLFKSEFVEEKKIGKEIIRYSKTHTNVRLHYLDIRDHFDFFTLLKIIKDDINVDLKLLSENTNNQYIYIEKILNKLTTIEKFLQELTENKNNIVNDFSKIYHKNIDKQKYYLNKVINIYNDVFLQKNILSFINDNYNHILLDLNLALITLKYYIKNWGMVGVSEVNKLINNIREAIIDIYSLFTDSYLLRRVLDKNYVNKSIIYTGVQHSVNYIYFLVKYYNFTILNIHNIKIDISELLNKIYIANNVYSIYPFFYINNKKYKQCIKFESISGGDRLKSGIYDDF